MRQEIVFKEWLPDQPSFNNPGLEIADNVLAWDSYYIPFSPLLTYNSQGTLPAQCNGMFAACTGGSSSVVFYAGTDDHVYMRDGSGTMVAKTSTLNASGTSEWAFLQWENLVITTNLANYPMYHTIGAATNFVTINSVKANIIGRINQFVMLGDFQESAGSLSRAAVKWSAIDNPLSWPDANSATAIATQAGVQYLDESYGKVQRIVSGDQYGLVIQEGAVTRVTYVGPPVVFQFDVIDKTNGMVRPWAGTEVGGLFYFASRNGHKVTDGVAVKSIGAGKVDKTFKEMAAGYSVSTNSEAYKVRYTYDHAKKNIFCGWQTQNGLGGLTTQLWFYNPEVDRWAKASDGSQLITGWTQMPAYMQAKAGSSQFSFDINNVFSHFQNTAGSSNVPLLRTGLTQLNPGGRAYVDGVKPNVEYAETATSITCRLGYRNDLLFGTLNGTSFTGTTSAYAATGFANFRTDAKYISAEVQIKGDFNKAIGFDFDWEPSGDQ